MGSGHHTDKDRLRTVLGINIVIFIAEILAGYSSGSLSMLSDSFHVSLHVFVSLVALISEYEFLGINPDKIKLWSAGINIALFFPLALMIAYEAYLRWQNPPSLNLGPAYFAVAFLGLAANLYTVFMLKPDNHEHRQDKIGTNRFILFVHMIFDTVGSVIVIIGAFEIIRTDNYSIDPASSTVLAGMIVLTAIWMSWELIHGHSQQH